MSIVDEVRFYINGNWVAPISARTATVIDPATEMEIARIGLGDERDVDHAVMAAKAAFPAFARTTRAERLNLLQRIFDIYAARLDEMAAAMTREMGVPVSLAKAAQAPLALGHLAEAIRVLRDFSFEHEHNGTLIVKEPIGVCAMITPWNWPIHQVCCKVVPALAAGCTMVLKPSELAPLSAHLFAEVLHAAGVPKGVFNLVDGDGAGVGQALALHPEVDMISFTGSTLAGIAVASSAAGTVKRVTQELGGKSANILLPDCDLQAAVSHGVQTILMNSGQSCNAPSRMLVPESAYAEVVDMARTAMSRAVVGPPSQSSTQVGPVVGRAQFDKIQRLIQSGINEGAELICGGPGRPPDLNRGFYVRPTIFGRVQNTMRIAREEIFGPVLSIMTYESEQQAIDIANDTRMGLSGYVSSRDPVAARRVAGQLRAGNVHLNGAPPDLAAPFGGYKQSGNGREFGEYGLAEYLELKAVLGYAPAPAPAALG